MADDFAPADGAGGKHSAERLQGVRSAESRSMARRLGAMWAATEDVPLKVGELQICWGEFEVVEQTDGAAVDEAGLDVQIQESVVQEISDGY